MFSRSIIAVSILLGCFVALTISTDHHDTAQDSEDIAPLIRGLKLHQRQNANIAEQLKSKLLGVNDSFRSEDGGHIDGELNRNRGLPTHLSPSVFGIGNTEEPQHKGSPTTRPTQLPEEDSTAPHFFTSSTKPPQTTRPVPEHTSLAPGHEPKTLVSIEPLPRSDESASAWNKVLIWGRPHDMAKNPLPTIPKDFVEYSN